MWSSPSLLAQSLTFSKLTEPSQPRIKADGLEGKKNPPGYNTMWQLSET